MFDNLAVKALYILLVAIAVSLEHFVLAERWKGKELARRTVGIATVLGLSFPLAVMGVLSFSTWLWLLFAFGVAGAVTAGAYTERDARKRRQRAAELRGEINVVEEADGTG